VAWLFNCFVALVIIFLLGGVIVFLLWLVPNQDPDEKQSPHILQYGQKFLAYMVMPTPGVYQNGWPETMTSCQVVFIKSPPHDVEQRLRTIGGRLLTFKAREQAPKDERIIENVFKSEIGYPTPLRVPDRITDGLEAYTVSVKMRKETWPPDWQPQEFMEIKVVFDGPEAGARRVNHVVPEKYRKV
jgi:hypothetical protein